MKFLAKCLVGGGLLAASVTAALAESGATSILDLAALPGIDVWGGDGATLAPLAMDAEGQPLAVVVRVPANSPAHGVHATSDGQVRLVFVISGVLYYADGETVDHAVEAEYRAGSTLLIQSGTKHWVSTRDEPLELLLVASPTERLTPPVAAQLSK